MNLLLFHNWFHSVIKEVSQANVELFILNLLTEIFLNELMVQHEIRCEFLGNYKMKVSRKFELTSPFNMVEGPLCQHWGEMVHHAIYT